MPPINVAMAQSLHRRTVLDVLAAAVYPVLSRRDTITDVKTAFSSWDNCMAAVYCKWPVIALIIIGGLIIVSVIWCIARCAFCGLSCCCECCYCLKCCGDCCGCCSPPRGRAHKYLDEPFVPPNHGYQNQNQNQFNQFSQQQQQPRQQPQGLQSTAYRSEEPMMTGAAATARAPAKDVPQFATFEVTKKEPVSEDSLPEMPSWDGANHTKVLIEEESMELTDLKKPTPSSYSVSPVAAGPRGSPGAVSPPPLDNANPYGGYGGPMTAGNIGGGHPAVANGYMAAGAIPRSTGLGDQGYGQQNAPNGPANPMGYGQNGPGYRQNGQGYGQNGQSYGQNGQGYNQGSQGYNSNNNPTNLNRQYSTSDYNDAGYGGQAMGTRQQSPLQSLQSPPGYGVRSPGPQQPPQQAYARNMPGGVGGGGYDSFGRNASPSPGPQEYNNLDRRTPRIPNVEAGSSMPITPISPGIPSAPSGLGGGPRGLGGPSGPSSAGGPGGFGPSELYGEASPRSPPNGRPLDNRPAPVRTYSPAPRNGDYSSSNNNINNNNIGYDNGSNSHAEAYEMPGSLPNASSSGGFDFSSGYSRPPTRNQDGYNNVNGRGNGYDRSNSNGESYQYTNTASPPPLVQPQPRQAAYPGYRPYK